ncbi:unnamed protein product [Ceutorhynchus assimilis]|uniref:Bax inhibitor 1 n=1 Tax=Ceutorhynchus assimilis TaxID=467358 RepID=A0A9N9ME85_9CUCU|nr:unnamed protein product [Ceutorhynchus assimilis]
MASVNISGFINSFDNKLEPPIKHHLKNVYACLAMSTLAAGLGAIIATHNLIKTEAGLFCAIGAAVFLFLLLIYPDDDGKETAKRVGYLFGFSVLSGFGMGPLLKYAMIVDPSIIVTALISTSLVFVSFSLCAIFSERGKWLYLGGILLTLLNSLMLMGFANIFLKSTVLWNIRAYLGIFVMCGYILYDTQAIIVKRKMGSKDVVAHALDLFVDVLGIFRKLLIVLSQKEEQRKKRRNS